MYLICLCFVFPHKLTGLNYFWKILSYSYITKSCIIKANFSLNMIKYLKRLSICVILECNCYSLLLNLGEDKMTTKIYFLLNLGTNFCYKCKCLWDNHRSQKYNLKIYAAKYE